jgi:hypothetical protein
MERYGAKVQDSTVTEVLVLADGSKGDEALSAFGLVEQAGVRPGIGWSWDGEQFAPPPPPPKTWDDIRRERDRLLAACDWTQVADAPVDSSAWAVYRQALRDVPQDYATPDEVVWPTPPA